MMHGDWLVLPYKDRLRIWEVKGVFFGKGNQEDLIEIAAVDRDPAETPSPVVKHETMFVPLALAEQAMVYRKVDRP